MTALIGQCWSIITYKIHNVINQRSCFPGRVMKQTLRYENSSIFACNQTLLNLSLNATCRAFVNGGDIFLEFATFQKKRLLFPHHRQEVSIRDCFQVSAVSIRSICCIRRGCNKRGRSLPPKCWSPIRITQHTIKLDYVFFTGRISLHDLAGSKLRWLLKTISWRIVTTLCLIWRNRHTQSFRGL